ncbi:uncharacterized protein LOC120488744 isoform X2 [Pimephales promelas]|nr:uncharacterized protein LOC120488744 isoform X2 [Pimephales promelas]
MTGQANTASYCLQGGNTMTAELPQDSDEDTTDLWNILFRRQHLQQRLQFLQEVQKRNSKIEGNLANEDGPSELDKIEEELELLEQKEKDLIEKNSKWSTTQFTDKDPNQAAVQGLYILPVSPNALQMEKTGTISSISALQEENTETTVKLEDVTMSPANVKCPSCHKTVTTEIRYKVGSNAFLFCCLLSVVG